MHGVSGLAGGLHGVFRLGIPFPTMGLHMGLFPMGFTMWFPIVVCFNGPSS